MQKIIILDTETTGTAQLDRICQLSYIVLDSDGKIEEIHNEFCKPPVPLTFEAMSIHHITPEMLEDTIPCVDTIAYKRLLELNTPSNIMVIQNAEFDLDMLLKEGMSLNMKLLDTFRVLRALYPDDSPYGLQFKRYQWGLYKKEKALVEKYNIEIKAHDALGDVVVLLNLFEKLLEDYELDEMIEMCESPIVLELITFGKHKGKRFEDVAVDSRNDLRFMLDTFDLDEDLKATLEYHLEATKSKVVIKLKFGKYFGKTPDEIVLEDRSYLVWLSNNAERLDKDTIEAIAVALKK